MKNDVPQRTFTHRELSGGGGGLLARFVRLYKRRRARLRFQAQRRIASLPVEQLFPRLSSTRACIQAAVRGPAAAGNVSLQELVILSSACKLFCPKAVFEFGTYDGLTALHLAMNAPGSARVFTLDLDPADPLRREAADDTYYTRDIPVGQQFQGTEFARKIQQLFGNSVAFDAATFAKKVDFLFVDGGHDYEVVACDSRKALEMVAPGGTVFWHDYSFVHEGVYTCLNELSTAIPLQQIAGTALVCYRHLNR